MCVHHSAPQVSRLCAVRLRQRLLCGTSKKYGDVAKRGVGAAGWAAVDWKGAYYVSDDIICFFPREERLTREVLDRDGGGRGLLRAGDSPEYYKK